MVLKINIKNMNASRMKKLVKVVEKIFNKIKVEKLVIDTET